MGLRQKAGICVRSNQLIARACNSGDLWTFPPSIPTLLILLAISSSTSLLVFWLFYLPSVSFLPCIHVILLCIFFYFHAFSSTSLPPLFPHLFCLFHPPNCALCPVYYNNFSVAICRKDTSQIVFLCPPFFLLLPPSLHTSSSFFIYITTSLLSLHSHMLAHTRPRTKCWINSFNVPAHCRWSFISGGCGKVTGRLPIIKTSSSEMTLSTVIDFHWLTFFFFFFFLTKDVSIKSNWQITIQPHFH